MPTCDRESTRLDYILVSSSLGTPNNIGYNPFYFIYNSDHQAIFINIPIKKYLQLQQPMVNNSLQEIGSTSTNIEKFINTVYTHLVFNNVFGMEEQFIKSIDQNQKPWITANHIDFMLGQAIQAGKKLCHKPTRPPWSEKLHHASLTLQFWIIAIKRSFKVGNQKLH